MPSVRQSIQHINNSSYKLDTGGVVGLFGGDVAVDALSTVHLYAGRRFVGWYNYPGTSTVAMRFGRMAKNRWWDSVFPGPNDSPSITFRLAGQFGPDYTGSYSGTKVTSKYLGHLVEGGCELLGHKTLQLHNKDGTPARKTGSAATFTIISVPPRQPRQELIPISPKFSVVSLWALIPSLVSILTCVLCLIGNDPVSATLILYGIVSGGISSFIFGTARLRIRVPVPSASSPPGDGLMYLKDGSVILLKGDEAEVNIITKGEFELDYSTGVLPDRNFNMIGVGSFLLGGQSILQLLLISLCTFFGQIMFLLSFIVSGMYHLYVVSHQMEKLHRELLFRELKAPMEKWEAGTRTQMAVFVCACIADGHREEEADFETILEKIIPNETRVWKYWRAKVLKELELFKHSKSLDSYEPSIEVDDDDLSSFLPTEHELLVSLVRDAWCVFKHYSTWRDNETGLWRGREEVTEKVASLGGVNV